MGNDMHRRDLLKTTGAIAVVGGVTGCLGGGGPAVSCPTLAVEPNYKGWLDDVSNYEQTCDLRGRSNPVVKVGVEGSIEFFKYGPPAVAISPGTTVTFRWTGRGGAHNVVSETGLFSSGDPVDQEGKEFDWTFDSPGVFRYFCTPHRNSGMKGVVFVALGERDE